MMSRFIKESLGADKINIGAIGNIVSQLHIHVIGRRHSDATWPGVVWGAEPCELYSDAQLSELKAKLGTHLGSI